jgi:predicted metal-dependent hydrolase
VAVAVDPAEGVSVRAPEGTPVGRIDEIVHRKARWILDRRRRHDDLPPRPTPREFVSGETFLYLGRQYRLKLNRTTTDPGTGVKLIGGHLHVPKSRSGIVPSEVRNRLAGWYRARAEDRIPERVDLWADRVGAAPRAVLIRDQRKRWGSADSAGMVRINWRVIQAPLRLVDYVVAHELVQLRYPDHTRAFWAALGEAMDDYEARREALRRMGSALVW